MNIDINKVRQELGRRKLSEFISYTMPDYSEQWFHKYTCDKIQAWHRGEGKNRLMVFMPPQHGKSQISSRHAPAWMLGDNPNVKVGIVAYNSTIASGFSRRAQAIMTSEEYALIFPDTKIPAVGVKSDKEVRNSNEVEIIGQRGSIVSVGVGGGLTSKQIDRMIIDDVYKDHTEAWSPLQRKNVEDWFDTVVETRLHNDSKVLIVFTRWHEEDLAGYLLEQEPEKWDVVSFPAIKENNDNPNDVREIGQALWEERHSKERLLERKAKNPTVFENLYQQDPQPQQGLLYGNRFKTYESDFLKEIKSGAYKIFTYVDVADSGGDYLCAVTVVKKGEYNYVIDVVYNNEGVEVSETLVVNSILSSESQRVIIESNAGGSIYLKNIKRLFQKEKQKNGGKSCVFKGLNQRTNKESRIISNAGSVVEFIVFPKDWVMRWPVFHKHVTRFDKQFKKNENDDAPDTLTGIIETGDKNYGSYAYGK